MYDYTDEEMHQNLKLLAPTGRASKRMSESTNYPATTIHRFLKWNKENNSFSVNEWNKDPGKFFILDETSMIDTVLLSNLLKGILDSVKLVFVGDFNQLPSVGPGQVLKDFIDSKKITTVSLDYLYRQDEHSYITTLAHEIKEGKVSNFEEKKSDFQFLECKGESLVSNIKKICMQCLEKGYDETRLQIMAPMYRGKNGIDNLNKELQNIFNPPSFDKKELKVGDVLFREQDKILQLVNMPEENIFNGDVGFIDHIIPMKYSKSKKNEIYVNFDGTIVKYLPKEFYKIRHGYVISIHKSQGSEFDFVLLPFDSSYHRMLYRKLVYTAVTRAKKKLILLGNKDAFLYSVSNNLEYIRKTRLKEKLEKIRIKNED